MAASKPALYSLASLFMVATLRDRKSQVMCASCVFDSTVPAHQLHSSNGLAKSSMSPVICDLNIYI